MCGIAGYLNFDSGKKAEKVLIEQMTDVISYRGPDGNGYYVHDNIALGHRRLSIIDLQCGGQPMLSDDGTIALVFNGEIYNYIELRDDLKKLGKIFKTTSDTEVIIKAYEQWGVDCQTRFNGMWAFALWDDREKQLLLSRDRIGEKPLHYATWHDALVFGSEIKSISAYGVPKEQNLELLEIYLSLGYIPAPYTFYQHIQKLKPGHCIIVKGSEIKDIQYWDLPEIDEQNMSKDKKKIFADFEVLFKDSLKIRMRSDVPYGAFLSGGLDSSSIVAHMAEISSFPVETFTIGFNEKSFDERHLAKIVADKFVTNHHEQLVEPENFNEALDTIFLHFDEPFGDSSAIPTGHVSKFAASKVKMVLTGDGGDEVLSGYTMYQGEKFATQYQKLPQKLQSAIPFVLRQLSRPLKGSIRYNINRMVDVCNSSKQDFLKRYLSKASWTDGDLIKRLTKGQKVYPVEQFLHDFLKSCTYKDSFYKLMFLNLKLSLPDDMLAKVDRMSMAHSIETRTPFLDHRLIEYMAHVHKNVKMHNFQRKTVLRNTIAGKLPPSLLNAPKKGFSVPLREWFKDDAFASSLNNLGKNMYFLNRDVIGEVIRLNKSGEKDLGNFIWMLFVLEKSFEN